MNAKLILLTLTISMISSGFSQSFSDKIAKEVVFEKKSDVNALVISNINGNVSVTGYAGDKVIVEVTRRITAKTQERLEKGKADIKLGFIDRADTLIYFVEGGCNNFGRQYKNNRRSSSFGGWGYGCNCGNDRDCNLPYDYKLDFTVKVPENINLVLSTINDGDITVENIKGSVYTDNINGSIKMDHLSREARASTINGDVDITYDSNPEKDCRFYTLNGNINAWFQKGLAANMTFESFNGEFFTNIDQIETLPAIVQKEQRSGGTRYKINNNRFKIGKGGVELDFETFNGNVYLKEKN